MAFQIQRVDYYQVSVAEEPTEACGLLGNLCELGVNLLAFAAVPVGPGRTQLSLFPKNPRKMRSVAEQAGLHVEGPHPALLVQGDDELGALARVHAKLRDAGVNVYASNGVADGRGGYGYVLYVRPEECERAMTAFEL